MAGTLYVVATPIGNLEDITVRALRILREVALIAAEDTRRTAHLLTRYGITTPTTSLHEHNEHRKSSTLVARLESGESLALVSDAGTPTVSDPGALLIREAIARGIKVEAIPGPNAALAALSVSGLLTEGFVFLGFPTWDMQLPPPVKSFLRQYSFRGKTIIPFNTNGGYGPGSSFQTVRELCPQSTILEGFTIRGGSERDGQYLAIKDAEAEEASKEVETWLKKIGIMK